METRNGGLGILGVLQIVFIVLKLVGTISWSWWLVLTPLWISIGLFFLFTIIMLLFMGANWR